MVEQLGALINEQGMVFWGAVAAVALGLTLLLVTGMIYVRQWHRQRTCGSGAERGAPAAAALARGQAARAYGASLTPGGDAATGDAARIYQEALLSRLQAMGDRLEALGSSLPTQDGRLRRSGLKHPPAGVEYVFKKGIG
ncbi:hypothetical protein KJ682_11350 [bacterium]|nr:hypothetical protein [bacterium]